MYTAVLLFLSFIFFAGFRRYVTYSRTHVGKWWSAYYFFAYGLFFFLWLLDMKQYYTFEIVKFNWLNDKAKFPLYELTKTTLEGKVAVCDGDLSDSTLSGSILSGSSTGLSTICDPVEAKIAQERLDRHDYLTERELEELELPEWLRILSLSTPIFVLLTFLISMYHTYQHHMHIQKLFEYRYIIDAYEDAVFGGEGNTNIVHNFSSTASSTAPDLRNFVEQKKLKVKCDSLSQITEFVGRNTIAKQSDKYATKNVEKNGGDRSSSSSSGRDRFSILRFSKKDPFMEAIFPHDLTIQVVFLPVVYSMMSFKSVLRILMKMTASTHSGDAEEYRKRALGLEDYYESNYQVADLYEAWAIWCFSRLCVRQVLNVSRQEKWSGTAKLLFKPLSSITLLGVEAFVVFYSMSATYALGMRVLQIFSIDICDSPIGAICGQSVQGILYGAGFASSCLALYNIVLFEVQLHHWLEQFSPFWKFWTAKILVSLAFMQTFILKLVLVDTMDYLTVTQQELLYSAITTFECLPIAMLHVYAWDHNSPWYSDKEWLLGSSRTSEAGSAIPTPRVEISNENAVTDQMVADMKKTLI